MAIRVRTRRDDDTCEEVAIEPETLRRALEACRRDLDVALAAGHDDPDAAPTSRGVVAREVGRLGDLLRLAGQLPEAERHLMDVIQRWRALGRARALTLARLKLASVWRQAGRHGDALTLLDEVLMDLHADEQTLGVYLGFLWFERGLTLWRAGRREAAVAALSEAQAKHRAMGAKGPLEATQKALLCVQGPT